MEKAFEGKNSYDDDGERCFGGKAVKPQHLIEENKDEFKSENHN